MLGPPHTYYVRMAAWDFDLSLGFEKSDEPKAKKGLSEWTCRSQDLQYLTSEELQNDLGEISRNMSNGKTKDRQTIIFV